MLFSEEPTRSDIPVAATIETGEVPIGQIVQNPYQPRKHFDHDQLAALSASVREHGILQPLVCRNVNGQLQLIAGERRLRERLRKSALTKVPIRIVDFNDQQTLEAAPVENIQPQRSEPDRKALGFKEHLDRFGFQPRATSPGVPPRHGPDVDHQGQPARPRPRGAGRHPPGADQRGSARQDPGRGRRTGSSRSRSSSRSSPRASA